MTTKNATYWNATDDAIVEKYLGSKVKFFRCTDDQFVCATYTTFCGETRSQLERQAKPLIRKWSQEHRAQFPKDPTPLALLEKHLMAMFINSLVECDSEGNVK